MTLENAGDNQEGAKAGDAPKKPLNAEELAALDEKYSVVKGQEQVGPDNFVVDEGKLTINIASIKSGKDGIFTFKADQVDRTDTSTAFAGGFSRDIEYAVFKQGSEFKVQKILNPNGASFAQDVRGEEADAVLKSGVVSKYLK